MLSQASMAVDELFLSGVDQPCIILNKVSIV